MLYLFQGCRNGFGIGGGGAKYFYITLTYKRDTILFISISVISKINLSYQSILALSTYTYLYVTIFKLLIFLVGKILVAGGNPPCSYGHVFMIIGL